MDLTQKIILTVLGLSLGCVILALTGLALNRFLRVRNKRQHTLRLTNQGNVPVVYQLQIETAVPGLGFVLRQGKHKLEEMAVPIVDLPLPPEAAQVEPSGQVNDLMPVDEVPNPVRSGKALAGFRRSISNGLGQLGRLLPGEAGRIFREQQAALSRVQSVAGRGAQIQSRARRKLKLPPKGSRKDNGKKGEGGSLRSAPPPVRLRPVYLTKTPLVHPGEALDVNLHITSKTHRAPLERFKYIIRSVTLPQAEFKQAPAALSKSGEVVFPQLSAWRSQLPVWISSLVALLSIIGVVVFLAWLW